MRAPVGALQPLCAFPVVCGLPGLIIFALLVCSTYLSKLFNLNLYCAKSLNQIHYTKGSTIVFHAAETGLLTASKASVPAKRP